MVCMRSPALARSISRTSGSRKTGLSSVPLNFTSSRPAPLRRIPEYLTPPPGRRFLFVLAISYAFGCSVSS